MNECVNGEMRGQRKALRAAVKVLESLVDLLFLSFTEKITPFKSNKMFHFIGFLQNYFPPRISRGVIGI